MMIRFKQVVLNWSGIAPPLRCPEMCRGGGGFPLAFNEQGQRCYMEEFPKCLFRNPVQGRTVGVDI